MLPSFILRLCKFVFCEALSPLLHGRKDESHRRRSRAYVRFAKHHPPFARLAGGDEFLLEISTLVLCSSTFLPWDLRSWRFFVFDFLPWALRSQGLFCLKLFAHKDFYVFEFLPWALRSQGLFCLRLFAHKDFYVFEFLPWALRSQGLFCLRLFAHKDFYVVGSKAKGSEAPIRDCVPCLLLSSFIACFMRRWLPSSLGEEG